MGRKSAGDYSPDDIKELDPRRIAPRHENMRKAIGARGLTLEQFAALMSVGESTLSRWLSGDEGNAKAYRLPNEALVRAARHLGVSVWYLLDLTDSPDGSGAEPFRRYEALRELWGKAKDPEKAAPKCGRTNPEDWIAIWYAARPEDANDVSVRQAWLVLGDQAVSTVDTSLAWRFHHRVGYRHFVPNLMALRAMWDKIVASPGFDPEGTLGDYDAFLRWFQANEAELLRRDLLDLRGDYRDPLAVMRAELEYASKAADRGKFDALLTRIDAGAREAMDALA